MQLASRRDTAADSWLLHRRDRIDAPVHAHAERRGSPTHVGRLVIRERAAQAGDVILSSTLLAVSTVLLASDPCLGCVTITTSAAAVEPFVPPEAPRWDRTGYGLFGVAPMSVMRSDSFTPGLRFDFETGFAFTRKRVRFSVGPDLHLVQYFGRKKPALGIDAMFTGSWGPVYARAGVGVMSGLAATRDLEDMRPGVGGVVGIGLQTLRDHVGGRVGVDFDFRMDTAGRPVQTVMVSLRLFFG
jgi:hypothetical protein